MCVDVALRTFTRTVLTDATFAIATDATATAGTATDAINDRWIGNWSGDCSDGLGTFGLLVVRHVWGRERPRQAGRVPGRATAPQEK